MTNSLSEEAKFEGAVVEPGDGFSGCGVVSSQQQRVVGPSPEADDDLGRGDVDAGAGVHELAENGTGLGDLKAIADALGEQAVEGASHQGELDIEIDLHGHCGRQRVHVEEVDGVGNGVFDDHAARVAVDQPGGRFVHLVGEQQGRLFVAEIGDGDLADVVGVVLETDLAFEDPRRAIDAADVGEGDLAPVRGGRGEQFRDHLWGAPAERQEGDAQLVQLGEVGIGRQAAVEDEFGGQLAGAFAPGRGEAQDLVVLAVLAEAGVGPSEEACVGVAGEEGEDAFLAAAALGDVVAFEQGVVAVKGDGVEIEVEGASAAEVGAQAAGGMVPGVHQCGAQARVDAAGVFGEGGALGDGIEAGEQGEPLVEGFGHDPRGPADAPQLEGEQRAEGAAGRDHRAARQAVLTEHVVEPGSGEVAGKQEQAAEVGTQAAGG